MVLSEHLIKVGLEEEEREGDDQICRVSTVSQFTYAPRRIGLASKHLGFQHMLGTHCFCAQETIKHIG